MKILVVNHGYPIKFNAGSEIYTQNLVHELLNQGHEVEVFSRDENPFLKDFAVTTQTRCNSEGREYKLHLVNVPRQKDRYQTNGVDDAFEHILDSFNPDIVHFNHLNHLSLGIVEKAHQKCIKIVFTLHDFWLTCPRGQFVQINYGKEIPYKLCSGQENIKCATNCYSRYHSGLDQNKQEDIEYWSNWVGNRQKYISKIIDMVDVFVAPSPSLKKRIEEELSIPPDKIRLIDYGFDLSIFQNRQRNRNGEILFGYIGTHIVQKGIHQLIEAFNKLTGQTKLIIFGRSRGETTPYLKDIPSKNPIIWKDEYINGNIVTSVFNHIDVVVVPSIWVENSPLVIHEAQQSRIPVITADAGGMADYVHHMKNGLLFKHRDTNSMTAQMQRMIDQPSLIDELGSVGYLHSSTGDVPSIQEHVKSIVDIYKELLQ